MSAPREVLEALGDAADTFCAGLDESQIPTSIDAVRFLLLTPNGWEGIARDLRPREGRGSEWRHAGIGFPHIEDARAFAAGRHHPLAFVRARRTTLQGRRRGSWMLCWTFRPARPEVTAIRHPEARSLHRWLVGTSDDEVERRLGPEGVEDLVDFYLAVSRDAMDLVDEPIDGVVPVGIEVIGERFTTGRRTEIPGGRCSPLDGDEVVCLRFHGVGPFVRHAAGRMRMLDAVSSGLCDLVGDTDALFDITRRTGFESV